jgi:aspartyl-tRNA(Asn)/glutamyl-tRNA(Gln) amidotransferase subunit A
MANPEVAPDVVANTRECLDLYTSLGASVEPLPDGFDWAEPAGRVLYQAAIHHAVAPLLPEWADRLTPSYMTFAEWGAGWHAADILDAQAERGALFARVQALFERFDVLISPTTACTALDAGFDATTDVTINGRPCGITRQSWTAYQYPFNLTGHPALSVPSGFGQDGLPTGLQIIGPWHADPVLLALGSILEVRRPWADKRPARAARGLE